MVYLCSMTCSVIRYSNTSFITVRFEKCLNNWIWRTSWQSNSRWGNKVIYDFYKILAFGAWIVYYIGWIPLFCSQKPSIRPYAYSVTDMPSLLFSFFYSGLFYLLFVCTERSLLSLVTITDTHTHTHTHSRIPLDEGSARRRDLCLTTQNIHNRETALIPAGFELANPRSKQLLI